MTKNLKIRRILILISVSLMLLGIIMLAIKCMKEYTYADKLSKDEVFLAWTRSALSERMVAKSTIGAQAGLGFAFGVVFYIFALIGIFGKSATRTSLRKWPFIVMMVLAILGLGLKLWWLIIASTEAGVASTLSGMLTAFDDPNKNAFTFTPTGGTSTVYDMKEYVHNFYSTYSSAIVTTILVAMVCSVAQFALHITQLVLIAKAKKTEDRNYSEEVIKAAARQAAKQNDLP